MLSGTEIVRMAKELAGHAGARQVEIARNVANADTPGYRARDLVPFAELYSAGPVLAPRASRPGHIAGATSQPTVPQVIDAGTEPSPNGNTVSLETEMLKAADVRRAHGLALAVYQTSLDMMRTAIGRAR